MRLSPLLLSSLLLAACHHAPPPAPPAPPPPPPTIACAKVAEHLVSLMDAAKEQIPQDALDKMTGLITQSCEATAWTEDAKACTIAAGTHDEVQAKCQDKLTEAQGNDLNQRLVTMFGGAGSPPPPSATAPAPAAVGAGRGGGGGPGAAPPPAPAADKASKKRSAPMKAPKRPGATGGDPCDGSE